MAEPSSSSSTPEYQPGSSTDSYPLPEELTTGTSRGRGRGSRRGGRAAGRGRGGRGGRGGSRARGKRVQRGLQIEASDEERLTNLRVERKRKAHEMVDRLEDGGARKMLKRVADHQPAIILDLAAELTDEDDHGGEPEPPTDGADQFPSWCICQKCIFMESDVDKKCCGMRPNMCHSIQPEMELYVVDPIGITINQMMRDDIYAHSAVEVENVNKSRRHAAYRLYILWQYGRLPRYERHEVPACCVGVIRRKYPDPNGQYTGYRPGIFG